MKQVYRLAHIGILEYRNRILTVRFLEGIEITESMIKTIFEQAEKMAQGYSFCILADVRSHASANAEARMYSAKNPYSKNHLAYATLTNKIAVVILTNFFIKVNKPTVPARLFKKELDALIWLQGFLR